MRNQAYDLRGFFLWPEIDLERVGRALHTGWELKRRLGSKITTSDIDRYYDSAMGAGAAGGRLCGAGGGGFLMFLVRPEKREQVRQSLADLKYVPIGYEVHGSKVLYPMG